MVLVAFTLWQGTFSYHSQAIWDSQYFALSHSASRNVFWQKNQIFLKNALFVLYFKEAKLSPAEWCWRLRFEDTMKIFVKTSRNNNKMSHCVLKSQPSVPFSWDSIWLLWNPKQSWHFLKIFVFLPEKHSLKLYGITQNMKSPK